MALAELPQVVGQELFHRDGGAGRVAHLPPQVGKVDNTMWQFGAYGFGPRGDSLCGDLLDLIAVCDDHYRHGLAPQITMHPTGTPPPTDNPLQLLVARRHTSIVCRAP